MTEGCEYFPRGPCICLPVLYSRHVKVQGQPYVPAAFNPGHIPGTYFYWSLGRPQGHSAARIVNDPIWDRTRDLPVCRAVPQVTAAPRIPRTGGSGGGRRSSRSSSNSERDARGAAYNVSQCYA